MTHHNNFFNFCHRRALFLAIIFNLNIQAQSDTAIFSSTEISDKFYNISEVKPPQVKKYKKEYTHEDLKEKYESFMESQYLKKIKFIGYEIAPKRYYIGFSFEVDTTGKVSNFKDLFEPNSIYQNKLNDKASDGKKFLIPATITKLPVRLLDTIEIYKWEKERKSTGTKTYKVMRMDSPIYKMN